MSLSPHKFLHPRNWTSHVQSFAIVAPLLAAVIAPFAVLLDIPGLTERWFLEDGQPVSDRRASLILSGVGLAFGALGNLALVVRFSLDDWDKRVRYALPVSVHFWFNKVIISTVNLIVFGASSEHPSSSTFSEGFWCAVVSDATSFIILALLVLHYANFWRARLHREEDKVALNVRVSGRHFMLQTTWFIAFIGISALIFSQIEGWTYYEGIYFFIVTFLTIGFGDLHPTRTSTYILLFPVALIGIASLGSLLSLILQFFGDSAAERKAYSRALFERQRQSQEDARQDPDADLTREITFLERLNERADVKDVTLEFALSTLGFLVFWLIGAAIFSALEGWTFGIGLYFCYVFFFTLGYGDYFPTSPAGRVVFIIYALIAVPIMAAFALQAVTQIFTRISIWRLEKRRTAKGVSTGSAADDARVLSHAEFVAKHYKRYDGEADEAALVQAVLERGVALEMHARRLLMEYLPNGSRAQVIMKADRNVQLRDLRSLLQTHPNPQSWDERAEDLGLGEGVDAEGEAAWVSRPLTEEDAMSEVAKYRDAYAAFLVAGSRLRRLEGHDRLMMERWKGSNHEIV